MSRTFKIGLFLTIMVFFVAATWWVFGGAYVNNARWVALAVMTLFALSARGRSHGEYAGSHVKAMALAFALIAVFSSAWSRMYPVYTMQRGLSVLLLACFLVFALWPRLKRPQDWLGIMNVIVASAWVMTLVSVGLWRGGVAGAVRWPTGAVQGAFGNPNGVGMVYAVVIPVILGRFHYKKSVLTLALLVMSAALVVACQSRAGLLGAIIGVTAFYAGYYGKKLWIAVALMAVLAGVFVFMRDLGSARSIQESTGSAFQQALMRGETDSSEYGSGRIPLWTGALKKWKERPFVGYGFGTAGDTYYVGTSMPARFHSSLIQIAAELGLVGVFFFIAPLIYSGIKAVKASPAGDMRSRAVIAGLAAGWFGGMADAFFESWLFSVGNAPTLLAWICFFAAIKALSQKNLSTPQAEAHVEGH